MMHDIVLHDKDGNLLDILETNVTARELEESVDMWRSVFIDGTGIVTVVDSDTGKEE